MLTREQIQEAEAVADFDTSPSVPLPVRGGEGRHEDIATQLLRGMFNDNLRLATRMMDIGDCSAAERLLQSAITQARQIASYGQPPTKPETTIDV